MHTITTGVMPSPGLPLRPGPSAGHQAAEEWWNREPNPDAEGTACVCMLGLGEVNGVGVKGLHESSMGQKLGIPRDLWSECQWGPSLWQPVGVSQYAVEGCRRGDSELMCLCYSFKGYFC